MTIRFASSLTALAATSIFLSLSSAPASAATLTWDAETGDGTMVTAASGNWNTTAGNAVWNDGATPNLIWSQTSATVATNAAVFAGSDGTLNGYVVTVSGVVNAQSLTFSSSGYQITGGPLNLRPDPNTSGPITVAAEKMAAISSSIAYTDNKDAPVIINSGATLNLSGGASNSQYRFSGAGSVNMTAGTYTANVGFVNTSAFHQSGGTFTMNLPSGSGGGYVVGNNPGRNVTYTLSGGTINARANADTHASSFLAIGRNAPAEYTSTLHVTGEGVLNVGTTANRSGELLIASLGNSNGTLKVSGGTVTVGTGKADNRIYFFKVGSNPGCSANLNQSGGTVTANGIQFGGDAGSYDSTSSAQLTLSGGSLYIGTQGIIRGSLADSLPVSIRLQGGTLGASAAWSSSLDMKIGMATMRAANSGGAARNITLSGVLSDDAGAGTLIKTGDGTLALTGSGDNTFTGATVVSAGTLDLGKVNAVSRSSSLTIADGAGLALSSSSSTVPNLAFEGSGALSFNVANGCSLTVSDKDGVTSGGAPGSITINITGNAPANGTYTLIGYSGALQGSGFSAYTLGSVPAGKSYTLSHAGGAVQLVVASACTWTGAQSSEWSTAIIGGSKNWSLDGSPADYADGLAVFFDDSAANKTVAITGPEVAPQSVEFSSGVYTVQGSGRIAGRGPVTVAAAATLRLGSSDVLPDGAGTGNVTLDGFLDMNGHSDTINALGGRGWVDNTAEATTSTLALGANAGGSFSGSLTNSVGTLALWKTGATDLILNGSNTYSGGTTVDRGRLFINASTAFSPNTEVTVSNGASLILSASGAPVFNQSVRLASGSNLALRQAATLGNVALPPSGSVRFNFDDVATQAISLASDLVLEGGLDVQVGGGAGSPGAVTLTGFVGGLGGLVKNGNGLLALGGANAFDGGVTIRNGTLEARTSNSALGTGTLTLGGAGSAGATFITGRAIANPIVVNAPVSGSLVIGANGNGSGYGLSGGITLNGDLTLQTFNNPADPAIRATGNIVGGITGTGNLVLNNNGLSGNVFNITTAEVNHLGSITLRGTATGNTNIGAAIGSRVTAITQNSATSTMVLSGRNSYACNLTINTGTVRIADNANTANDVSTVTIAASGAALDLTYSGSDTVGRLVIGTTELASGVYGKLGSADPVIGLPQITGDGTLTVGSPGVDFASWIAGTFANGQVDPGKQGPADDPDGDGVSNLLEFAIEGQDPTVPNPSPGSFNGSTLSFEKRRTPAVTGIFYAIEESTDLGVADAWHEVGGGNYVNDAATVSYSIAPGASPRNFLRLRVSR